MAQGLKALVALLENPDWVPSTHMATHNYPYSSTRGPDAFLWLPLVLNAVNVHIYVHANTHYTHTYMYVYMYTHTHTHTYTHICYKVNLLYPNLYPNQYPNHGKYNQDIERNVSREENTVRSLLTKMLF